MTRIPLALVLLAVAAAGCGRSSSPDAKTSAPVATPAPAPPPAAAPVEKPAASSAPVAVLFKRVNLRVDEDIVLEVRQLEGELISVTPGKPPLFDDQRSFILRIDAGEVAMSTGSLSILLNRHVFADPQSPLKNLKVSIEEGHLKQSGTLHKGIDVPFSIVADASATPDGRIKLHPLHVKAAGIPAGGLMKAFGLELDELIKLKRSPGAEIKDDDFFLDPNRLLPSPRIDGHLIGVRLEPTKVVEIFGGRRVTPIRKPPDARARNFMYYGSGTLVFGKLTMSDADMQLIDADPRDPFDFFPAHYIRQLVAGYSKNTAAGGLKVYMPDYGEAAGGK